MISTIAWFLAGNPFGIDSSYFALFSPLVTMAISQICKPSVQQLSLQKASV